ncbi:MAG TPA: DUF1207 domain-containing protein [Nitrospira sp.]|nr:DUF1207 domain-containing protein [Nitrospira sp.]
MMREGSLMVPLASDCLQAVVIPSATRGQAWGLRTWVLLSTVIMVSCLAHVIPASAEEQAHSESTRVDCRYEGAGRPSSGNGGSQLELFPENDVFRPLLADPKQPQFFATWQATRVRAPQKSSLNMGSVGFGENFGLVGRRNGCDGWQVGILPGVFAQFDLDSGSTDLLNADYVIGVPVSFRSGLFSARARLFHQSSHLGDEFLLNNPRVNRVNLSFEVLEAILSLDAPGGWGRAYAGGATAVHIEPSTLDRNSVHWGGELRGPTMKAPLLAERFPGSRLTPILAADFQAYEDLNWTINTNVVSGLEWSKAGSDRRFRLLINYYRGYSPYGQFFGIKLEMVGLGLYFSF